MQQLHFDSRDIFKAPRFALGLQRIWIQFVGLVVGYAGYLLITYLSLLVSGIGLAAGWKKYGLLPCLWPESPAWYGIIIYVIAVVWLVAVYLISATAVSRATYMLAKGNHFYTWRNAYKFALRKAGSVLLSPVALLIMIGLFLLGGAVVGLIGRIPFVGEFGITLFTVFWFLAALLVVLFAIVFAVAMIQAPSIIATTDDDAFEAVFQSFSLIWTQPWRLVFFEALSAVLAIVAFLVLAFLSKKAFIVMDRLFSSSMGADYINISAQGMYLLNVALIHSINWINSLLSDWSGLVYFSREFDPLVLPTYQYVASYIFAFWMLIIGGFILSYGLASFNVGNTLSYLILRKKKDDDNLLERKDAEEEEEESEEETKDNLTDEAAGKEAKKEDDKKESD